MREAIEPLGWGCAFANDIAPKKAEMYRDRFGHSDLSVADVHDISAVDIPAEIDLFTASFPCVDLSLAGNRQGIDGADSGAFWPFMNLLAEYCDLNPHPRGILYFNQWKDESPYRSDDPPLRYRKNVPFGWVRENGNVLMKLRDGEVDDEKPTK